MVPNKGSIHGDLSEKKREIGQQVERAKNLKEK